jgi:hypothetical protein
MRQARHRAVDGRQLTYGTCHRYYDRLYKHMSSLGIRLRAVSENVGQKSLRAEQRFDVTNIVEEICMQLGNKVVC